MPIKISYQTIFYGLLIALLCAGAVAGKSINDRISPPISECASASNKWITGGTFLAKVWSGVNTGIGTAVDARDIILAAYYDSDRYLTLTSFNASKGLVCHKRLPSRFGGWDAHNSLSMAIAKDGTIHVAGNMHASALVYARGTSTDIESVRLAPMIGHDEQSATYPQFMFDGTRNLLFLYRDGRSGAGRWLVNRWDGKSWSRISELFARHDGNGAASAYPSEFVKTADGRFHVAVVWRRNADVASNFSITYASTRDFQIWDTGEGAKVRGPLTPEKMETVDVTGEGKGLVNNIKLALSAHGQPVILYTRYGEGGHNAIFAANHNGQSWIAKPIAIASSRKEISGGGSLAGLPVASFGKVHETDMQVNVSFGGRDTRHFWLDAVTLDTSPYEPEHDAVSNRAVAVLKAQARGMADVGTPSTLVRRNGVDGPVMGRLRWFAQKANSDRPRLCTRDAPLACKPPPSPLLWFPGS